MFEENHQSKLLVEAIVCNEHCISTNTSLGETVCEMLSRLCTALLRDRRARVFEKQSNILIGE